MRPCVQLLNANSFLLALYPETRQGREVACPFAVIPANAGTQCPQCPKMTEDTHYKVLKLLETNPELSQRQLAKALGVSLGKANYCIGALIDKGLVKAGNFKNSDNKRAYFYVLTPRGIEAKAKMSVRFLARKMAEYETLGREIERLKNEWADGR